MSSLLRFFPSILPDGLSRILAGNAWMANCLTAPVSHPEKLQTCSQLSVSSFMASFQASLSMSREMPKSAKSLLFCSFL